MKKPVQSKSPDNKPLIIIGIVVLSILLIVVAYYFISALLNSFGRAQGQVGENVNTSEENFTDGTQAGNLSVKECLALQGYNTFLFLYSPYCPHCERMLPVMDELIANGYKVVKVDVTDSAQVAKITGCAKLQPFVPQYVCPYTGATEVGELPKEQVIELYNQCASSGGK